uniref:Uncharacterized protein n=1 Tax=Arundo donax TaxID=35708 RepID=A0A0A8XRB7_ARUDO
MPTAREIQNWNNSRSSAPLFVLLLIFCFPSSCSSTIGSESGPQSPRHVHKSIRLTRGASNLKKINLPALTRYTVYFKHF